MSLRHEGFEAWCDNPCCEADPLKIEGITSDECFDAEMAEGYEAEVARG